MSGWRSKITRACEVCAKDYHPSRPKDQRFCGFRCANVWKREQRRFAPENAIAARKRVHNDWVRATLRVQFGTITERELAIFLFGNKHGYDRAHAKGYYAGRKAAMRPKQPCRNHPDKWANDKGNLCRACIRAAGDTRSTREIQKQESKHAA